MMVLSRSDNKLIGLLFVCSITIFINLGSVSLSFPIGIYALFRLWHYSQGSLYDTNLRYLTFLVIIGIISGFISPVVFSFKTAYFLVQLIYWLLLARTIGLLYPYIDKHYLSKCIAFSCLALGVANLGFGLGTQNSVAFTLVILGPLGIFSFQKGWHKILYGLALIFIMLFNESRSGLAIIMCEMLFISVLYISRKQIKRLLTLSVIAIAIFISSPSIKKSFGIIIEPYNPEMALLLTDPDFVQARDKSWIQRQVQIQKGLQIFEEHPIIGIGPNNFTAMFVNIRYSDISDKVDSNALSVVSKSADHRSTHNTYITLLSEFGLIGIFVWCLFILTYLIKAYKNIKNLHDFEYGIFICAIGLSIYFYTIAALYGTSAWLFYGLIYGYYRKLKLSQS